MRAGPLASGFFMPGSRIRVDAHTETGAPDSSVGRYAARFVQKLAGAAVGAALAVSLGASDANAAATTPSRADMLQLNALAVGSIATADAPHLKIRVHEAAAPTLPGRAPEARYEAGVCDVTLDNVYNLRAVAPSLPDARHPQLRADFVVVHETAHCEALAAYAGALPTTQSAAKAAGDQLDRLIDLAALPMDVRRNVGMLFFERQADAKALLHLAYRTLSNSQAPAEALHRFDLYVEEALALRTTMHAEHLSFDDHESAAVIREVQSLVHSHVAGSSTPDFAAFAPDVSGKLAMQLAVGSIERDFAQIRQALLEVETASLHRALAEEEVQQPEAEEGGDLRLALAHRLEAVAAAAKHGATKSASTSVDGSTAPATSSTYERFLRKSHTLGTTATNQRSPTVNARDGSNHQAAESLPAIRPAAKLLALLTEKPDVCCAPKQPAP